MNKFKKETYTRTDIESSLKKEFPDLNKPTISEAIDTILESIIDAVALDEKVEIIGFSFFARLGLTVKLDIPTILSCFPNLYRSSVVSSVKQTILCGPLR